MKILNKIMTKQNDIFHASPVTIAFLGDSVTQGCFECYFDENKDIQTYFDYKSAYSTRFKEILNMLYPSVQLNIINSGISGDWAENGSMRFDRDISPYNPDLVVVAFGLNDSCQGMDKINNYLNALQNIFDNVKKTNAECIFIAQNMMNTTVSPHLLTKEEQDLAKVFMEYQNGGVVKAYFEAAKALALKNNVKVCDMYSAWEKMALNGVNTTELLANKYNHPIRELHYYTAIKLIETIFEE